MSGYLVGDRAAMIQEAGASAFLTKPFDASAARALVARLLPSPKPEPRA
jgi:DNA-binding NtrC family response regulator